MRQVPRRNVIGCDNYLLFLRFQFLRHVALSISSPARTPVLLIYLWHASFQLPFTLYISPQHFPQYVFFISPRHMSVPVQSSSRVLFFGSIVCVLSHYCMCVSFRKSFLASSSLSAIRILMLASCMQTLN